MLKGQNECTNCHAQYIERTGTKPEKAKKGHGMQIFVVSLLIAIGIVAIGLYFYYHMQQQNENDAYENAMLSSEPAVLQNYLDMYGDAPQEHRDSITSHLEILKKVDTDWANALVNNSKMAFQQYMQTHPNSVHQREALLKIDSVDWAQTVRENTPEAYQQYMTVHQDGMYYDEAKLNYDKTMSLVVTPADKEMVSQLFNQYFHSLATQDEGGLLSTVSTILTSFLHKTNASKTDVIGYMKKIHEAADIMGMDFLLNNDWKIDKIENSDGEIEYSVTFSVDQKINRSDPAKEKLNSYKVSAKVSPEGKITDLNMKKVMQ